VMLEGRRPVATRLAEVKQNGSGSKASQYASANGTGGKLWILPTGGSLRSQSDLKTAKLPELLEDLRIGADFVVLDTPPALLTVEMSELAGLIDSVLVVVRHGRVTHRSLRTLNRQARRWPAEMAGVVVTDAAAEGQYSYYGGR